MYVTIGCECMQGQGKGEIKGKSKQLKDRVAG
jgi:hypothetical protein